jgi:arylsulfatase A-like enzyme
MHITAPRQSLLLVIAGWLGLCLTGGNNAFAAESPQRPNIVFIMADDLGWADLGCYGSKFHQTPNIDALARRGMQFRQAYSASPLCSPTRASILTGLYPARIGITNPSCHVKEVILEKKNAESAAPTIKVLQAISETRLKTEYFTLAEAFKEAGYRTGHFGKWHLGAEPYDPLHQGFDVDFPHYSGPGPAGGYVAPWKFPKEMALQGEPGEHIEDRVADEVVKFIRTNKDQPFFVNYWCFSVHSPWGAKPELIEKYRTKVDSKNPQHNPVYAAMVQSLDEAVGRVVQTIDELGLAERTIFVFTSDNGGVDWHDGEKMKERADMDDPPTSNLPLRAGKASLYEGGTREPCLVVWPGVTKAGSTSEAIVLSTDFYPTLLEICSLKPRADLQLDGISFTSALKGSPTARDTLFCHFPHLNGNPGDDPRGGSYVRQGDWKLIRRYHANDDLSDKYELFNLRDDLGETKNLAQMLPEKVQELRLLLDRFLSDTEAVVPKRNPAYVRSDRWSAGPDAKLAFQNKVAVVESTSNRPTLQLLKTASRTGVSVVKFRMCATGGNGGLVLWGTEKDRGFSAERRVPFMPIFDGQWHDYEVAFTTTARLQQLRIDGSLKPTRLEFASIQLCQEDGTVVQAWDFAAGH